MYGDNHGYCPNGCAPYCYGCGAEEELAPGIDYYCPTEGCTYNHDRFWANFREEYNRPKPMEYPGVAVGVIVFLLPPLPPEIAAQSSPAQVAYQKKYIQVLLGKRKGPLGTGLYSVPGGKVDFGEPPFMTASREVEEETGLKITDVAFTGIVSNDWFPEKGKHFINMFYTGIATNPQDLHVPESEKDKFDEWQWFYPFDLPSGVWMHTAKAIQASLDQWLKATLKMPGIDE